jgi:cytoskeletal protein CcmA (bactofilin family)
VTRGVLKLTVNVRIALIGGYLEAISNASHHAIIDHNARVEGNIHVPSLTVRDGAVFKGARSWR